MTASPDTRISLWLVIGRWTDSLNLFLITRLVRVTLRDRSGGADVFGAAVLPDASPSNVKGYVEAVCWLWIILASVCGVLTGGLTWLLDTVDGNQGNTIAVTIGTFLVAFCSVGAIDALWRYYFARAARRRYYQVLHVDDGVRQLIRIARLNDATIILQLAGAALIAWLLA